MAIETTPRPATEGGLPFPVYTSSEACITALREKIAPRSEGPMQMIVYNQVDPVQPGKCELAFVLRGKEGYVAGYGGRYDTSRVPEHLSLWDPETRASFEARRLQVELVRTAVEEAVRLRDSLSVPVEIVTEDGLFISGEQFAGFQESIVQPWPRIIPQ